MFFCFQNALKLTYEHPQFLKFFRGLNPRTPIKAEGKEFVLTEARPPDRGQGLCLWTPLGNIPNYYCRLALLLANHHRVHCPALTMQTRQLFYQVKTLKLTTVRLAKYEILSATSVVLSRPKYTKIVGGRGSAPDPAEGAHDAPPDPLVDCGGYKPL